MTLQTEINVLPAIDELRELTSWGWAIQVDVSMAASASGQPTLPQLVGLTARRDVPGGTCTISVRTTKQSEDICTLAKDLLTLCSGLKVVR